MNAIDRAMNAGMRGALAVGGRTITYFRDGDEEGTALSAIRGHWAAAADDGGGVLAQAETADWTFYAAAIAGDPTETDYLTWDGNRYELASVPGGRCWDWATPDHSWVTIHTVRVAETGT